MREIAAVNETEKQVDPVCGMRVTPEETERVAEYQGRRYLFCAEACRRAFVKNPESYLAEKPPKKKGWWGRYLARLGSANKETFGPTGPQCH